MSTRTALRRLRSNVHGTAWGTRYTLTVRIPRDAFPEPYPTPSDELTAHLAGYGPTGDLGIGKKNGDGTGVLLKLSSRQENCLRACPSVET